MSPPTTQSPSSTQSPSRTQFRRGSGAFGSAWIWFYSGVDVVAVDWSGRRIGERKYIWTARVRGGELIELRNGQTRAEVIDELIAAPSGRDSRLVVGLDFAFSCPAWYLRQRQLASARALWELATTQGESWLAACEAPFWGRPGFRRPELAQHFRRTELAVAAAGGIGPKSVFQIGGAGAVGTGTVRGLPSLLALQHAGFSIWPFDPPATRTVVEIYPRLLTGPVIKRSQMAREAYLAESATWLPPELARFATSNEDAFDAAVSAIVMSEHASALSLLDQTTDPETWLEGQIWAPPTASARAYWPAPRGVAAPPIRAVKGRS